MTEEQLFAESYNAHEQAESDAIDAIYARLRTVSLDALACLADPQWPWETRSHMSCWIIDAASEVLDEKLEALVAV